MTPLRVSCRLLLAATLASLSAAEPPVAGKKSADPYPLKTCVVSGEPLDSNYITYVHQEAGKPDRVVRFCCDGCIEDFKGDPAKFLQKLDEAAKKAAPPPAKESRR